ncbi:Fibronectin-binding A domain protein [Alkaliphilus metalliredigens QYMF]|uniref:Rqc2 homolog RqcH n=1 Tax=Alkaliphilus metalliredigens (strain QYMF) TaxID=293826 RepID=A6TRX6_ALKMQ|nr:NFACT RNA binding domain-containing protein [Alkaliphilus metalliredigens]ABR48944.1 Fibronectin-binding A domain protein [Alkaliphilus metalliredigens QYMF]
MPLDGFSIAALTQEFQQILPINKIEKVYQPEKDEITLLIRSQGTNYRLLLTASSNFPRAQFTSTPKENPSVAPNFCMLLRKHIQGGRIVQIKQPDFERVIRFTIETYDELKVACSRTLIIEMMGRHSNIILINNENNKVIDSIKRVSLDISRFRQVLPGLPYQLPPSQDKKNPVTINTFEEFKEALDSQPEHSIQKSLFINFTGISPVIAREICYVSHVEEGTPYITLKTEILRRIYVSFDTLVNQVNMKNFSPQLYWNQETEEYIDFTALPFSHLNHYASKPFESISHLLEGYYANRDQRERMKQRSQGLRKSVSIKLDRLYNKIQNLKKDYNKAQKSQNDKIIGDLITANLHQLKKGQKSVEVVNFYDENQAMITIPLDLRLSPAQNAQRHYKKYNKGKTALLEVALQLEKTHGEINYLEQIMVSIDQSMSLSDVEEIRQELIQTGYIKPKAKVKVKVNKQQKVSGYLRYQSSEGVEILVGKNNTQNDEITFKLSSKEDLWFHVKDLAGSHVILKTAGISYSDQSILEAAQLAAYYSKGRNATKVTVSYLPRKHVKKPNGAKPGMVTFDRYSTMLVDATEKVINQIQQLK